MVRWSAWAGLLAQPVFVASWLLAALWQGPRYDALAHTISDMYAVGAPHGVLLVIVLTACGLATVLFGLLALRPALAAAGSWGTVASILVTLSIYGLGDLLSPFEREACRLADPGCTGADQVANLGGALDSILSSAGIFIFVAALFVTASAMRRTPGWERLVRPTWLTGVGFIVLLLGLVVASETAIGGLLERLLAATGAAWLAVVAWHVVRGTAGAEESAARDGDSIAGDA